MGCIYCITNLINNKRYVGKTTLTVEERFRQHCKDSYREKCEKRPLYDAMNKYGIENFIAEELEQVQDESELDKREIYWINELQTYGSNGYNATKGGDGKILYDYNEIIDLINLGYTASQVSKKIGCCKDIVYRVAKAHGIKLRRNNSKLVAQYDIAGNFVQLFFSTEEAGRWILDNCKPSCKNPSPSIRKCCEEKEHYNSAYGYIWKYLPDPV